MNFLGFKKTTAVLLLSVVSVLGIRSASAQATYTTNPSDGQITTALTGTGLGISNPVLERGLRASQIATFTNGVAGAGFGLESGVLFSTGLAGQNLADRNSDNQESEDLGNPNPDPNPDPHLIAINPEAVFNTVSYSFDIELGAAVTGIRIVFQFGSEEYPDYVGSTFNDLFGFFVSGPGIGDGVSAQNFALLPSNNSVIAVNSVNGGILGASSNPGIPVNLDQTQYYINNGHLNTGATNPQPQPGPFPVHIEYNGITTAITRDIGGLVPGETYRFKVAIADVGDGSYDSGVLLRQIIGLRETDLSIEKTVSNPTPVIGEIVSFSLKATNKNIPEANPVAQVSVVDLLPSGYTYVSAAPTSGTYDEVTGVWDIGEMPVGAEADLVIQAIVNATGDYRNLTSIEAADAVDIDQTDNFDEATITPVPRAPDISIAKAVDKLSIAAPGTLNYSITLTNTGNVPLAGVVVTDPLTNGGTPLALVSGDGNGNGELDLAESWVYQATYEVTQAMINAGTSIVNTASVTTEETPAETASATTTITQSPSIQLVKTAALTTDGGTPGAADAGDVIEYTFVVTNTGNVTLSGITLDDHTFSGAGTPPAVSAPVPSTGSSAAALLPGGTLTYTASYTANQADIDAGAAISNQATATGTPPSGPNVTDESGTSGGTDGPTDVPAAPQAPSLQLVKTAALTTDGGTPGAADAGDVIEYTFVVTNTGNVTLSGITLDDHTFSGAGTPPAVSAPVPSTGSSAAALLPGGTLTYTASYTANQADIDAGAAISNQATATGTPPSGPNVTDESGTSGGTDGPTDVPAAPQAPSLQLVKTAALTTDGGTPGAADAGDVIEYTFVVTNTGNVTLSGITLDDHTFSGAGTPPAVSAPVPSTGSSAAALLPGGTLTYTASYTANQADIDAGAAISNQATATGTPPSGPNVTDESGTSGGTDGPTDVPAAPQAPSLQLVKTAALTTDGGTPGAADAGDVIEYTFVVTNTGNVTLSGITLDDHTFSGAGTPPAVSAPVPSTGSSAAALLPGGTLTYTASYTANQADIDAGAAISNQATATGTPPSGPNVTDESGTSGGTDGPTDVPAAPQAPSLQLVKTAALTTDGGTPGAADAGDVIEYTFVVTNTGNVTLSGITLDDHTFSGAGTPPAVSAPVPSTGSSAAALLPGGTLTYTASYTANQADIDAGAAISNQATATGTPPSGPNVTDESGTSGGTDGPTDVPAAPQAPSLQLVKTAALTTDGGTPGAADAGDVIEYTFVVTNTGNVTLSGITLDDHTFSGAGTPPAVSAPVPSTGSSAAALLPGGTLTYTASYTANQADIDAGAAISNQATATGTPPSGPNVTDESGTSGGTDGPTDVPAAPQAPSLQLVKTAALTTDGGTPGAADAGDVIEYTFVVTNTGNVTLSGITLDDHTFSGAGTPPAVSAPVPSTGSSAAALLPGGTLTYTASYTANQADIDAGAAISNQATATGTPPSGPNVTDESGTSGGTDGPTDVPAAPQAPSLSLTKRVMSEGPYALDDYITYSIVATNTGNVTLTDVTVSDANAEIVSGSPIASLAPGESATVIARHRVTQADLDGGLVANQAKVTGNDPNGDPVTEVPSDNPDTPQPNDPTVVQLDQRPALALTKRATSEGPYALNQYITYSIVVTNTGNVTLTDVTVSDANAEIVSGSPIAPLAPGTSTTVTARHRITQTDIDAGTVVNQAKVTGNDPDGDPIPEVPSDNPYTPQPNDPTVVQLDQRPALALTKRGTSEGPYALGEYITYSIVATNTGNVTLTDVTVSDANAEIVSGSPIASLAPGASATVIARHRVTQEDLDGGLVANQAKVTGNDPDGDPIPEVPSDNPDTPQPNDPTVVEISQRPDLSLTKRATSEGPYALGEYIYYSIVATNTGNVTLTDVTVSDANAEIVSGSPIASLAPGASATVIARHRVTQEDLDGGLVANQAKVTGNDPDGDPIPEVPSDNPDTPQPNDPTVVQLDQRPALALTKRATSEGPYALGEYITYSIVATNTGNVTLTDVTVSDANAEIVSGSPIASLAPGASATVIARHRVTQADIDDGTVVNQARVTGNDPEGDPITEVPSDNPDTPQPNDPTVVETAQRPDLSLTKRVTSKGPYALNQYITYSIVATNTGNVTLTDVTVSDANAEIVSGSPIASLAPGASATVIARHRVTQVDIDDGTVVNQARVTGNDPNGDPIPEVPSDNPDTPQPNDPTATDIAQAPSLSLTKRITGAGPYVLDDYINYSIVATNTGNVTLTDVTVSDANAEIVSGSPVASLAPGASATVIARHRITQEDIDDGTVVNQARVIGNDPEGNPIPEVPSDNPDTPEPNDPTTVETSSDARLKLTKRAVGSGPFSVGDYIRYELVVTNTGNVTLSNVDVSDSNADFVGGNPRVASLAPGASVTLLARHLVTQADIDAGEVLNQATAGAEYPSGNPIGNFPSDNPVTPEPDDATVVQLETKPALRLTKGVTSEGPYGIGDYIRYYNMVVTNIGNVTLMDIMVTDENAEIIAGSPIARLLPGESAVVMARHAITQADIDAGQVVNQAKVSGKDPEGNDTPEVVSDDPDTPEPEDATVTQVAQSPQIRIDKRADKPAVEQVGERVNYQLQVVNTGNITLHDVRVSDPLTGFSWQIASIKPGIANAHTFTTTYRVTEIDFVRGSVTNTAAVVAEDPDGNPVRHETSVQVTTAVREIIASNDMPPPIIDSDGGRTPSILENDMVDGQRVTPGEVTIWVDGQQVLEPVPFEGSEGNIQLQPDGTVTIAPGATPGDYTLEYTICEIAVPNNCSNTATVTITVHGKPRAVNDEAEVHFGESVRIPILDNDHAGSGTLDPASVRVVRQPANGTVQINADGSVTFIPREGFVGTDSFEYEVTDENGYRTTASVTVDVLPRPLKIPNAFTPNGDGRNDRLEIVGLEGFDRTSIVVVNRWGNEVYRSDDYRNTWDGGSLTEGTYYYVVITYKGNRQERYTGWVLLKRM